MPIPNKFPSELRFDLASEDWVIIATGRGKRPEVFRREKRASEEVSPKKCPFCQVELQAKPSLVFAGGKRIPLNGGTPDNWSTVIVPNKYPALIPSYEINTRIEGNLYQTMNAVGFHEVVVTREHDQSIALLSPQRVKEIFDAYQERYKELKKEHFVNYISIFHNHGKEAGASISHPHSQIITIPLIDTDLKKSLSNSKKYFRANKKCIYCVMDQWEMKVRSRIVFENEEFLAVCPFASKTAFEVIISPKKHIARFEDIDEKGKLLLAEAFQDVMKKLYNGLNDPAYNFYLHTAPCDGKNYSFYHWHWTILPKTSTWAGFEIGTQIEISTIEPEQAAEFLRKK
ncbi:MAG: galactose-1-phosphate uridylyltransferase [bacterium]